MDPESANAKIKEHRSYRQELASPLRNPLATPEEKKSAYVDLKEFREQFRDPDYRQAMRIIADLRGDRSSEKETVPILNPGEIFEPGRQKPTPHIAEGQKLSTHKEQVEFPEDPKEAFNMAIEVLSQPMSLPILFILASSPGAYIENSDLKKKFFEEVKGTEMERVDRRTPIDYCKYTLQKHGLLAAEVTLDGKAIGYSLTDAGKKFGLQIAALGLTFERDYLETFGEPLSLHALLGQNKQSQEGVSSPQAVASILLSMREGELYHSSSLATINGKYSPQIMHVIDRRLTSIGLVEKKGLNYSRGKGKNYTSSRNIPEGITPLNGETTLTHNVTSAINQLLEEGKTEITTSIVIRKLGEERSFTKQQKHVIGNILSYLASMNYLKIDEEYINGLIRTEVAINKKGLFVKNKLLLPLLQLLGGDPRTLKDLNGMVEDVKRNLQKYTRSSADIYHPISTGHARMESETRKGIIARYIAENPGLDQVEIARNLGLNPGTIGAHLKKLQERGNLYSTMNIGPNANRNLIHWYSTKSNEDDKNVNT